MIKGVLPNTFGHNSVARCVMLYDWAKPVGPEWLSLTRRVFLEFGQEAAEGTGSLGDKKTHGAYKRIRKRLVEFLNASGEIDTLDMRVLSEKCFENEGFFPSRLGMAWSSNTTQNKKAVVAVRDALVDSTDELIERIGKQLFEVTGEAYGGAWDFPATFGPESYLSSVGAVPRGVKWGTNRDYSARITRWRDNIRHRKMKPSRGYFREIYPTNFLLETHLNMPFRDRPLLNYLEETGSLSSFVFAENMYRWDVPKDNLDEVRGALESSGLVLSSATKPLLIN